MESDHGSAKDAGAHLPFGDLLRRHRLSAGLSQEALADRAGVSADAVAALERGRRRTPRASTVRLLSDALGVGAEDRETLVRSAARTAAAHAVTVEPDAAPESLPDLVDEFVGRTEERADVVGRLTEPTVRLLTLTGPGGVGKTRLAVAAARTLAQQHPVTVVWVPLGAVPPGTPVLRALQRAIGLRESIGNSPDAAMVRALSGRPVLILLDDCEHLLDDCARVVETLLPVCPQLQVLATSQEILRARGEQVYAVDPLSVPRANCPTSELERSAAVRLFLTRASALHRTPLTAPTALRLVARICRRLEGIPLAIELAAARSTVLSLEQINDGLDDALGVLASGPRTALPRHRTLRAAVQWSYDLLAADERILLQDLSVFSGGWTLAAAHHVHGREPLGLLSRLADKSLISASTHAAEARFDLLDTIRQYAVERLVASGREQEVRRRHALHQATLATGTAGAASAEQRESWIAKVDTEQGNIRSAMQWSLQHDTEGADVAIRLAAAMWPFWMLRGLYAEGRDWLGRALASLAAEEHPDRAHLLLGAGTLEFFCCDYDIARRHVDAALAAYQQLGSIQGQAESLQRLGTIAREQADYDASLALHEQTLLLWKRTGNQERYASALNFMSFVSWLRGDLDAAADFADRSSAYFRGAHDRHGLVWALMNLGCIARYRGRYDEAVDHLTESLTMCEWLDYPEGIAWALNQLGACARVRGDLVESADLLQRSLVTHRDLGDRWRSASVLEELAITASAGGDGARAAYLFGVADEVRAEIGAPVPQVERAERELILAAVRADVPAAEFRRQWSLGRLSQHERAAAAPGPVTAQGPAAGRGRRAGSRRDEDLPSRPRRLPARDTTDLDRLP